MLVLQRKPGETVQVGPDILIQVVEIREHLVRLGFNAPQDIVIVRPELGTTELHRVRDSEFRRLLGQWRDRLTHIHSATQHGRRATEQDLRETEAMLRQIEQLSGLALVRRQIQGGEVAAS